jgi:hypothetical protein
MWSNLCQSPSTRTAAAYIQPAESTATTCAICEQGKHLTDPGYTLRRTWPELPGRQDYVFRHDGRDVGRAYQARTPDGDRWLWTLYIVAGIHRKDGVPITGLVATIEEAKTAFKASYEQLTDAGAN